MRSRLLLATLLALPCLGVGGFVTGHPGPPMAATPDQLEYQVGRALAGLAEHGLTERGADLRGMVTRASPWTAPLELALETGECVGVVSSAATGAPVVLTLRDEVGHVLTSSEESFVPALTHCRVATETGGMSVQVAFDAAAERVYKDVDGPIHVMVLRGDARFDAASTPMGYPSPMAVARLVGAERELAEARDARFPHRAEAPLFEPLVLTRADGALVAPDRPATRAALAVAAVIGTPLSPRAISPRARAATGDASAWGNDDAVEVRPLFRDAEGYRRVLAVIDPGDLPVEGDDVPCVEISFSRLAIANMDPMRGVLGVSVASIAERFQLARAQAPGEAPTPLPLGESPLAEGITIDRRCPGDGLTFYLAADHDPADYRLRVVALGERGPRQPAEASEEVPPHTLLVASRTECAEGTPSACLQLARHERYGVFSPIDRAAARQAYATACEGGEGCIELARFLDEEDTQASFAFLSERCAAEDASACAALGDRHRLGDGSRAALDAAFEAYSEACRIGDQSACANRNAMTLLELVTER